MIKLTNEFRSLAAVRERLGAEITNWRPGEASLGGRERIRLQLASGIELALDEIDVADGLFTHKGEQVVIYIKDHTYSSPSKGVRKDVRNNPEDRKKVHLRECRTIVHMKEQNLFDRYVATNRRDNLYRIDVSDGNKTTVEELEVTLLPCKNCLKELNYNNCLSAKSELNRVRTEFDIVEFLECYSSFFATRPKYTDETAPISIYIDQWSQLSKQTRSMANWICSKCGVNLSQKDHHKWLHVHHRNGQKGDNSPSNLAALCLLCHSEQPGHNHMYVDPQGRDTIVRARQEHGK